jgi:hypothetical protein
MDRAGEACASETRQGSDPKGHSNARERRTSSDFAHGRESYPESDFMLQQFLGRRASSAMARAIFVYCGSMTG